MGRRDLGHRHEIEPGGQHVYDIDLPAGTFFHVEVEQHGSDAFVRLVRDGRRLIQVDSRTEDRESEHLIYATRESSGPHQLIVDSYEYNSPGGAYRAIVRTERPAGPQDLARAEAELAFANANIARQEGSEVVDVASTFERAQELFGRADLPERQADALYELGLWFRDRDGIRAARYFETSLPLYERAGADHDLAVSLADLAALQVESGLPAAARLHLERAVAIFRRLGNQSHEAIALNSLGRLERRRGQALRAVELLERSVQLREASGDRRGLATSKNGLGEAYLGLGEVERALDHHRQALDISLDLGSAELESKSRYFIGSTLIAAGRLDEAADAYRQALTASKRDGSSNPALEPALLQVALGLVEMRRGNPGVAHDAYQEALAHYQSTGQLLGQATCKNNLAVLYRRLGDLEQALELHQSALEIYSRLEHRDGEARSLLGIARCLRGMGRTQAALSNAEAALLRIEKVLGSGQAPAARSDVSLPFLTSRQEYYSFLVDLLMELHLQRPEAGYDTLALVTHEQSRARALLERVSDGESRRVVDPELARRRQRLQEEINSLGLSLQDDLGPSRGSRAVRAQSGLASMGSDVELRRLLVELYRVTQEIRQQDDADSFHPEPLGLAEIQGLLGDDTTLLDYRLGEERSFLWMVSRDGLESHPLPPRREIDRLARRAYRLLVGSDQVTHRVPTETVLARLSDMVLGPIRDRLQTPRLLVVPDGSLAFLPFGVFQTAEAGVLRDHFEIVQAPSASVVAALRRRATARSPRSMSIALIADPVFRRNDARFGPQDTPPTAEDEDKDDPGRLPFSGQEAESIRDLATPFGDVLLATGFDADRGLVLEGRLAKFQILHFATHGVLHADVPELSSLILSRFAEDGSPKPGRLTLHEIYGLDLPADLVVLSACRSALGPESRSEGLLGLPRAFLDAGASRVLVSLWRVDDESTAELMTQFYRRLLHEGLHPAAALRAAQASLRADPRYEAPYHWAGFVLQGDWL